MCAITINQFVNRVQSSASGKNWENSGNWYIQHHSSDAY
jgi:hypothetical protein